MRPAYMTATRSTSWATTPRSWVMKRIASPRVSQSSRKRLRICVCTVTSRAVVGSSALGQQPHDGKRCHALAAAGFANEPEDLAFPDLERDRRDDVGEIGRHSRRDGEIAHTQHPQLSPVVAEHVTKARIDAITQGVAY